LVISLREKRRRKGGRHSWVEAQASRKRKGRKNPGIPFLKRPKSGSYSKKGGEKGDELKTACLKGKKGERRPARHVESNFCTPARRAGREKGTRCLLKEKESPYH